MHAAELLATEHVANRDKGGRPALVEERRQEKAHMEELSRQAATHTLADLLDAYCDHLKALGRSSHSNARSIFNLHVKSAWPDVSATRASDVTTEQVADMMRKLIEADKGRTANKLRSYVRAAYQTAKAARSKPSIPLLFKAYGVTSNPAAETEPDESQNRPDKRPLSASELRFYWKRISVIRSFKGALLRLHLLSGAQRIEQLVRLEVKNIFPDSFLLYDGKGRPGRPPRAHLIPITPAIRKALKDCAPVSGYALSTDGGTTHLAGTSLSKWATEVVGESIAEFQAKRLRSGVETLLASAGVPQDIRGRLQSHGISGVQARHYDGHDYLREKREALVKLHDLLIQPAQRRASELAEGKGAAKRTEREGLG